MEDVGWVLLALDEVGLIETVPGRARQIIYKCDVYTCLKIYKGKEYQLPVSIYRSSDVLPGGRRVAEKGRSLMLRKLL
ncbi:hypothetical protein MMYC01_208560 [Madurella mycetomatis]|uniref:Uncharacterized protein n=1 Tax=Madurella mycetomatis TaxID=100816 RepID=A0A175VT16_9PEZI|nr:hypothetical protein MMYC01_208560 [Madurella mycetomatis]